jgi:5-methylcytosine-specific restriction enzyme subunit McrC
MSTCNFSEYETRVIEGYRPTLGDKRLAEGLGAGGDLTPRMDVDWLEGDQVKVTTYSWIGVVRFSAFEIRVVPKLVGGTLRVLRMIEYADGVRLLARLPTDRSMLGDETDLFDLIVMLLTEETKALVRDGLIRDYHSVDGSIDTLRGRLRIREQYLRRYGQFHRIECTFDEFDGDIPENQLLAAALQAAAAHAGDLNVRNGARTFGGVMNEVCEVRTRSAEWYERNICYGRRNACYRPAHTLAKLVLDGLALSDHVDNSAINLTSFMVDMNALFERFVTRLIMNSLAGTPLQVSAQKSVRAVIVDEETGGTYSTIRPDLVIEDSVNRLGVPIDVKYKLFDAVKKVGSADIYQSFVYAYSLGTQSGDARAGLIYPALKTISGPVLHIRSLAGARAARIRGAGIDVCSALDAIGTTAEEELHERMLVMVREVIGLPQGLHPEASPASSV